MRRNVRREERVSSQKARWISGLSLVASLALSSAGSAAGQPSSPHALTLSEVLLRAREHAPAVLEARAAAHRAAAEVRVARGAYLPRLTLEASTSVSYDSRETTPNKIDVPPGVEPAERDAYLRAVRTPRYEATTRQSAAAVTLEQLLVDPARGPSIAAARHAAEAQASALSEVQRQAQLLAATRYVESVAAGALYDDARLSAARRGELTRAIAELVRTGLRPRVDLSRVEIDALTARRVVETRAVDVAHSEAALARALGAGEPVHPRGLDDDALPAPLATEAARAFAHELPALRALEETVAARHAAHRAAVGSRFPELGLRGAASVGQAQIWTGTGIQGSAYAASGSAFLRWAALDPSLSRRPQRTRAELSEARASLVRGVFAAETAALDAAYGVERTRTQLVQASEVLAAAEAMRLAQVERYRVGVASLPELLDAESLAERARRERIEAERDHRLARIQLLGATGALDALGAPDAAARER